MNLLVCQSYTPATGICIWKDATCTGNLEGGVDLTGVMLGYMLWKKKRRKNSFSRDNFAVQM